MGFCGVVGLEGGAASMGARGRSGRAGVVLGWVVGYDRSKVDVMDVLFLLRALRLKFVMGESIGGGWGGKGPECFCCNQRR